MPCFEGYLNHGLLVDADDPGLLLVVSRWASRRHADESLRRYAEHPNARAANNLVVERDVAFSPPARMAEPAANPQVLVLLANLGRPRRPAGAAAPYTEPILPDVIVASAQLAAVVDEPVAAVDLADLRRVQQAAVHAAEAILGGKAVDCAQINALAADSAARVELVLANGVMRRHLVWTDTSWPRRWPDASSRNSVRSNSNDRLRRCARLECDLLFYDTTRSRARRCHAEDPCGWRERQRAHRTRKSTPPAKIAACHG